VSAIQTIELKRYGLPVILRRRDPETGWVGWLVSARTAAQICGVALMTVHNRKREFGAWYVKVGKRRFLYVQAEKVLQNAVFGGIPPEEARRRLVSIAGLSEEESWDVVARMFGEKDWAAFVARAENLRKQESQEV